MKRKVKTNWSEEDCERIKAINAQTEGLANLRLLEKLRNAPRLKPTYEAIAKQASADARPFGELSRAAVTCAALADFVHSAWEITPDVLSIDLGATLEHAIDKFKTAAHSPDLPVTLKQIERKTEAQGHSTYHELAAASAELAKTACRYAHDDDLDIRDVATQLAIEDLKDLHLPLHKMCDGIERELHEMIRLQKSDPSQILKAIVNALQGTGQDIHEPDHPQQTSDDEELDEKTRPTTTPCTKTAPDLEELRKELPPQNSGEWIRTDEAACLEGLERDTLARYRCRGTRTKDKMVGQDKDGRIWQRFGTQGSHPRYLKSSLRSQNNH